MPGEFVILSLPPWLRYKANNILMSVLIPERLSAGSQRKYFKRMIRDELNVLVREGISTPWGNMKVKVFAQVCAPRLHEHFPFTCITFQPQTESRFEGPRKVL